MLRPSDPQMEARLINLSPWPWDSAESVPVQQDAAEVVPKSRIMAPAAGAENAPGDLISVPSHETVAVMLDEDTALAGGGGATVFRWRLKHTGGWTGLYATLQVATLRNVVQP
jgi:hypothetical protein